MEELSQGTKIDNNSYSYEVRKVYNKLDEIYFADSSKFNYSDTNKISNELKR
ncbi:MAG: hypothetical protein U9N59_15975 [Campylobacterota bacterium]|nr:hypothetical protein [Campylobacterota bacterium]